MQVRKITSLLLVLGLAFSLAACGNVADKNEPPETVNTQESTLGSEDKQTEENSTEESWIETQTAPESETGKTLVVYFSGSGNTKRVAEFVADETGADLFELIPVEAYTDDDLDWRDSSSRVNKEHDDSALQDIALTAIQVPEWHSYNTVFIGFPIWWHEAAWPVNNFVKGNDFAGKQVIPFCTSGSSELGESGTKLEQMAGTGRWMEGIRFPENEEESEIRGWVQSLDLE